ncbi:MAG TPA: DUF3108 domain-containing protein [Gemmatimonadaceae bacterium]|nr:DUF3108 domain-containing protein [Gemmatimonadaceae bacterium]
MAGFAFITTLATALLQASAIEPADTTKRMECNSDFSVPFDVGERLTYDAYFGPLKAGTGTMEVVAREEIRGIDTWHTRFRIRGGVPFYRVDSKYESWISTECFHSVRHVQDSEMGGKSRDRHFEIFPDRGVYKEDDKAEVPTVKNPLDDGSFFYFVRTLELETGKTYTFDRYFRPDRNPVIIKVLRREEVRVPAGKFKAIVIQPIIKSRGIFSENGEAQIWLSDDADRMMLQMKTKLSFGSLNLYLKSRPKKPAETR